MKDVIGYEGFYSVTDDGRIWSHHSNRFLKGSPNSEGYLLCTLSREGIEQKVRLHRVVAEVYIPNPLRKPYVNHKDGNKQNNMVSNLEWVSASENTLHAYSLGLISAHNKQRALTEDDVTYIRDNYKKYSKEFNLKFFAEKFNVSVHTIQSILKGRTYKKLL